MNTTQLTRFVAAAEELHFPVRRLRSASRSPPCTRRSRSSRPRSATPLFARDQPRPRLTKAGILLLAEAKERLAARPPATENRAAPAGGKAKASKGKGRAPVVKGQPKPYKKRQGR